MTEGKEAQIVAYGPVYHKLANYIIAADEYLEPGSGRLEDQRHSAMVGGLERLPPETLLIYGEQLGGMVAWEESLGIYGDDGIGDVRNDFYARLGPLFMHLQYADDIKLEGCGGLL
jgi:hypothetical protein